MTNFRKATISTSTFFNCTNSLAHHTLGYVLQLHGLYYTVQTASDRVHSVRHPTNHLISLGSTSSRASLQAAALVLWLVSPSALSEPYYHFIKTCHHSTLPSVITEKLAHLFQCHQYWGHTFTSLGTINRSDANKFKQHCNFNLGREILI